MMWGDLPQNNFCKGAKRDIVKLRAPTLWCLQEMME
jgi:hypothetical protein